VHLTIHQGQNKTIAISTAVITGHLGVGTRQSILADEEINPTHRKTFCQFSD